MITSPYVGSKTTITTKYGEKIEILSSFGQPEIKINLYNTEIDETLVQQKEAEAGQRVMEAKQREVEARQREVESRQREAEARQREAEARQREAESRQREIESRQRETEILQKDKTSKDADKEKKCNTLEDDWTDEELREFEEKPWWRDTLLSMRLGSIKNMLNLYDITLEDEPLKKWRVGEKKILPGKEKYGKNKGQEGMYEITLNSNGGLNINRVKLST
jgi:hypothetical protein